MEILLAFFLAAATAVGCAGTKQRAAGNQDAAVDSPGMGTTTPMDGPARVIGTDALGDAACAISSQRAQRLALDIYIMMDSSGSMSDPVAGGTTDKWTAVRGALTTFLSDPQSNGIGVGLQYFPLAETGVPDGCEADSECNGFGPCDVFNLCSVSPKWCDTAADCPPPPDGGVPETCGRAGVCRLSDQYCTPPSGGLCDTQAGNTCDLLPGYCRGRDKCDPTSYATPAVEVAPLPGAASALLASFGQHMPDGGTPTAGALSGAITHAQALARANPTHKVVVLLATDGLPSECDPDDAAGVAALASAARTTAPSISTYVIGVFAADEMAVAQPNLDAIAQAGGTGQAFIVSTASANVTQSFINALNAVRSAGQSCQYTVPTSTQDGVQVDYFSINVQFTSSSGETTTIGNVKNRASCSPTHGGWYYDVDPAGGAKPRTISICDSSCSGVRADPGGWVDLLLGCKTIIIID